MGYMELTANEVLNLASYGFKPGDAIKVTCVGGGGGSNNTNTSYWDGHRHLPGYGGGGYNFNKLNSVSQLYRYGERGNVKTSIIKLNGSINSIPVTIGDGGERTMTGGSTSFGSYVTALGGSPKEIRNRGAGGYTPRTKSIYTESITTEYVDIVSKDGSGIIILEW